MLLESLWCSMTWLWIAQPSAHHHLLGGDALSAQWKGYSQLRSVGLCGFQPKAREARARADSKTKQTNKKLKQSLCVCEAAGHGMVGRWPLSNLHVERCLGDWEREVVPSWAVEESLVGTSHCLYSSKAKQKNSEQLPGQNKSRISVKSQRIASSLSHASGLEQVSRIAVCRGMAAGSAWFILLCTQKTSPGAGSDQNWPRPWTLSLWQQNSRQRYAHARKVQSEMVLHMRGFWWFAESGACLTVSQQMQNYSLDPCQLWNGADISVSLDLRKDIQFMFSSTFSTKENVL